MQNRIIVSWQARDRAANPKARSWYWAVGIVTAGVAVAAGIVGDYLLSVIAVLGGFTVMLVGSAKPRRYTFCLTEQGFSVGDRLIPYRSIESFAIHEDEPLTLVLRTNTFAGTVSAPLRGVDWRAIATELKNRNIDEVESLRTFADRLARGIGL